MAVVTPKWSSQRQNNLILEQISLGGRDTEDGGLKENQRGKRITDGGVR